MPDGTTYLCGAMPRPPGQYNPGLLVHVDNSGRVINSYLVLPRSRTETGLADFRQCIKSSDGIVLLGRVVNFFRQPDLVTPVAAYWIVMIDDNGAIKSETQIPTSIINAAAEVGPLLRVSDSSYVFASTDYDKTELVHVSATGNASAKRVLTGWFSWVLPVEPDGLLQIYGRPRSGTPGSDENAKPALITLDKQFEEVSRLVAADQNNFVPHFIYRQEDKSFVMFGVVIHHFFGRTYTTAGAQFDPLLRSQKIIELPRGEIDDGGAIVGAATPGSKVGEFLVATTAVKRGIKPGAPTPDGQFVRGAALDWIELK